MTEDRLDPPAVPPTALAPGATLGDFVLEEKLGEGGFGAVWRARRRDGAIVRALDEPREVALKVARERSRLAAIEQEAAILRRVEHPGVVRVHRVVTAHEPAHIVMDLVRGTNLAAHLAARPERRLPWDEALAIADAVATALAATHAAGVVHGDIKPANVLLEDAKDGGAGRVVIADFGLGTFDAPAEPDEPSLQGSLGELSVEAEQSLRGTLAYLAPELKRDAAATPASDIYALGLLIVEMLTGALPRGAWRSLARQGVDAPDRLDALVRRLLTPEPGRRPQDAGAVAVELGRLLAFGDRAAPKGESTDRVCPMDGDPLGPAASHDVALDRCRRCGGTWFDTGEIAAVLAALIREAAEASGIEPDGMRDYQVAFKDDPVPGERRCPVCSGVLAAAELRVRIGSRNQFVRFGEALLCRKDGAWVPGATRGAMVRFARAAGRKPPPTDATAKDPTEPVSSDSTRFDAVKDAASDAAVVPILAAVISYGMVGCLVAGVSRLKRSPPPATQTVTKTKARLALFAAIRDMAVIRANGGEGRAAYWIARDRAQRALDATADAPGGPVSVGLRITIHDDLLRAGFDDADVDACTNQVFGRYMAPAETKGVRRERQAQ